jgi:hypothetical protein
MTDKYHAQVSDLASKLLMTSDEKRGKYWRAAVAEIKPRDREYFAGLLLGTVLKSFDFVIASHQDGAQIIRNLEAASDRTDFNKITQQIGDITA